MALAVVFALVLGLPVARYRVEPSRAAWSELASGPVAQVITSNYDSVTRVELFALTCAGALIHLNVHEYPDGPLVASGGARSPGGPAWIRFDSLVLYRDFVRGRRYVFAFDWAASDSVRCFLCRDTYGFGCAVVGGEVRDSWDLAMRVCGLTKPVDKSYFGAYPYFPMGGETWGCSKDRWKQKALEAGLHHARFRVAWAWVDSAPADTWRYALPDTQYAYLKDSLGGCEVYSNPYSCTQGTSTHIDSIKERLGSPFGVYDTFWSIDCPPCSLFLPVNSPHNYWARFVEKTVRHYDSVVGVGNNDGIHVHEIWNEPNVLFAHWKAPNARDYEGLTSVRARCSIYVRLCAVAHAIITGLSGHQNDRILVGSTGDLEHGEIDAEGDTSALMGKVWLRWMYEIANREYDGPFWDGVAFHYYDDPYLSTFEANMETLRTIMRKENQDYGQLWITEVGWPTGTGEGEISVPAQANAVVQVFTTALGSTVQPCGGYDRTDWFCFRDTPLFRHGLADTLLRELKPSFHSFAQVGRMLTGRQTNGRVMLGDSRDAEVRIVEFVAPGVSDEPRKLWVAWRNWDPSRGNDEPPPVDISIPTRTDMVEWEYCAYSSGETRNADSAGSDGWFDVSLTSRPMFVWESETGEVRRPDLVVDSVRVEPKEPRVGQSMVIRAWVRNRADKETRATPKGMATKVLFLWEGDTLGYEETARSIGVGETVHVEFPVVEAGPEMAGPALVKVVANPDQRYVELNMDNNDGYAHAEVR